MTSKGDSSAGSKWARWAVVVVGAVVLVATSAPPEDVLEDEGSAFASGLVPVVVSAQINRRALRAADSSVLQITVDGELAGSDAGVPGTARVTVRPGGESVPSDGFRWTLVDLLDRCSGDADCVVTLDVAGLGAGQSVNATLQVTDQQEGFLCASGGTFPEEAEASLRVE
ncbi:MAG: hypothetical protein JJ863_38675 [Deltaproteobacteria bacterium]|nr:hypothetical protein [Deltaproteobacteria bacterium]